MHPNVTMKPQVLMIFLVPIYISHSLTRSQSETIGQMNDDYFLLTFKWSLLLNPPPHLQVPVGNENQQVVQQQYQQQVMVPVSQSVQGPMPVYYSVITPTQQNSTR